MPEIVKKRKRTAPKKDTEDTESSDNGPDAMEILRRHFESQFAPLPEVKGAKKSKAAKKDSGKKKKAKTGVIEEGDDDDSGSGSGSEWEGLSEEEDKKLTAPAPEVIHFTASDPLLKTAKLPKSILKPFISTKPPALRAPSPPTTAPSKPDESDEEDTTTEAHHLQNDLALQRLLRESHLLDANLEATGKNRLKAIEARVQALGGRDLTKHKMPMAARVWMEKSRRAKEEKRRREAREAGIVLEREVRVKKKGGEGKRRERGAFGPSVGKFRNGTLVLSRRDVMDIEGRGEGKGGGKSGKSGKGMGGKGKGGKGKKRR
ncbi:hypothetical protein P167DRAFT_556053 [Morchella conica CCBAS932]|uniref:Uncharacterized protein n=1 Tax=Morchella conica CCBAS932 TaxID=1392247 RepID=A0A3N4L4N6_9PEZI|nr:hypothetical protein P167DRAFT_556053 [Morchella conica CCBAS932]